MRKVGIDQILQYANEVSGRSPSHHTRVMQRFSLGSPRFARQLVGIENGFEEGQSARKVADENVKFPDVANGFGQLFFVFRIRLQ